MNLIIRLFAVFSRRYASGLKLQEWQKADNLKISNTNKYWNEKHVLSAVWSCMEQDWGAISITKADLSVSVLCSAVHLASGLTLGSTHSLFAPIPSFPWGKWF